MVGLPSRKERKIKELTPLQIKKARQAEQEARLRHALTQARRKQRATDPGPTKRRTNDFLARYLAVPLLSADAIRPEIEYRARSYNLARQVLGLVEHLFVRYPVPLFLYRSMLSFEGLDLVFDLPEGHKGKPGKPPPESKYRHWFFTVARGESFAKAVRETFTKREAHWFLLAPPGNEIGPNILWAKAMAAGVPRPGCDYLTERIEPTFLQRVGDRLPDMLRFYADAWPQMRGHDRDEITDFVRAAVLDRTFSFKGRTFGSMRKLCHEWHRTVFAGHVREYRSWAPALPHWELRKGGRLVRALELSNNRALADEGRVQRHCVYTYTTRCLQDLSRIVSIRWFAVASENDPGVALERLTLEIAPTQRTITQIRGRCNRSPTEEEMQIVRLWAGDHGLRLGSWT